VFPAIGRTKAIPWGFHIDFAGNTKTKDKVLRREFLLQEQQDARIVAIPANWGCEVEYGRQVLPGQQGMDGFFYSCIQKQ